ncbi:uncharacterized protein LOC144824447 [Lissotriton helveticus]
MVSAQAMLHLHKGSGDHLSASRPPFKMLRVWIVDAAIFSGSKERCSIYLSRSQVRRSTHVLPRRNLHSVTNPSYQNTRKKGIVQLYLLYASLRTYHSDALQD